MVTKKTTKTKITESQEAFNEAIKKISKYKNVKGYILLVDNTDGGKSGEGNGACATYGDLSVLINLFLNIPSDLLKKLQFGLEVHKKMESGISDVDGLIDILKRGLSLED